MATNTVDASVEGAKEEKRDKRGGRGRDRREDSPREKSPYLERVVFINRVSKEIGRAHV